MLSEKLKKVLKKQGYALVGKHSVVHPCSWCKKALLDEGFCYKEKFYGIKSHLCCQMSPCTNCQNKCLHCWRAIELSDDKKLNEKLIDNPEFIIENSIETQKKLLSGFKGNKKINMKKFQEAQEPMQFAISLTGEPTLYPKLGEFIKELRKKGKTSFVVSNGLQSEVFKKLEKEKSLPTQLYLSVNAPNKKLYDKWHRSSVKNAWKKFNKSLEVMKKLKRKTRTVLRLTLVKELNMKEEHIEEYVELIKKALPDFIEIKGYMSVGFARKRLGYDKMPRIDLIRDYAERIAITLKKQGYNILDEQKESAVVLIGKDKKKMRIQKNQI